VPLDGYLPSIVRCFVPWVAFEIAGRMGIPTPTSTVSFHCLKTGIISLQRQTYDIELHDCDSEFREAALALLCFAESAVCVVVN
jgi:hypothetical protein